jgi:hypothetical protein
VSSIDAGGIVASPLATGGPADSMHAPFEPIEPIAAADLDGQNR